MSIKSYRPTTPGRRQMTVSGFDGVDKHEGDIVRVMETRPLSKDKRWRVVEIVEKAK